MKMNKVSLFGIALLSQVLLSWSFMWTIEENLYFEEPVIVSEGYMFGSGKGPIYLTNQKSSIEVNLQFESSSHFNTSAHVMLIHVATDEEHGRSADLVPSWCELVGSPHALEKLSYVYDASVQYLPLKYSSCHQSNSTSDEFRDTCFRSLSVNQLFPIENTAWHSIFLINCEGPDGRSGSKSSVPVKMNVAGSIGFKNPYGYISAELSGLLLSQMLRLLLCLCTSAWYLNSCWKFRDSLLPLHLAVGILLTIALAEAVVWAIAFFVTLNIEGRPYCCPFPVTVGVALILQVLRQALSRAVLLVVCLGYGIVRPKLLLLEWLMLTLLSLFYLAASLTAQSYSLARFTSLSKAVEGAPIAIQGAAAVLDLLFLLWISAAAQNTMRVLREYRQTEKLSLYLSLWRVLSVAVLIFVSVSIVFFLDDTGFIAAGDLVHWKLTWVQPALWDLLNVSVLLAVAILCVPNERAKMLAYHAQLPQHDLDDPDDLADFGRKPRFVTNSIFDEDDEDEEQFRLGNKNWLENESSHGPSRASNRASSYHDDDDDSGYDMEMVLMKQRGGEVKSFLAKDAFSARLSDDDSDNSKHDGIYLSRNNNNRNQRREMDDEFGLDNAD